MNSPVNYSVIAVNDSKDEGTYSMKLVAKIMNSHNHRLVGSILVRDERDELHAAIVETLSGNSEIIIIAGGMGTGMGNTTIPVVEKYIDITYPGFTEFSSYYLSKTIGLRAIFFRGLLGAIKTRHVYCIPSDRKIIEVLVENIISKTAGIKNEFL